MKSRRFTDADFQKLGAKLFASSSSNELYQAIVNGPFDFKEKVIPLGLGVAVLLQVDKQNNTLDRISLSNTEPAEGAVAYSVKEFNKIRIPLNAKNNILVKALYSGKPQSTDDWQYLFVPELTAEEARFNQAGAGIACSYAYPLKSKDGGAIIFSYFIPPNDIGEIQHEFMKRYAELVDTVLSEAAVLR